MQNYGSVPFHRLSGPTAELELHADDSVVRSLSFAQFRSSAERAAEQYLPVDPNETKAVTTSWGETLTAKHGDYLVGALDKPGDRWVVQRDIFEKTYAFIRAGVAVKSAPVELVPLVELTGNPDTIVTVHTLEGAVKARAGDFHLARGIKGEIWPYPNEKVTKDLVRVQ